MAMTATGLVLSGKRWSLQHRDILAMNSLSPMHNFRKPNSPTHQAKEADPQ